MENASYSPDQELAPLPENTGEVGVEIVDKNIDQMPPLGEKTTEGEEFWVRRKLRPDTVGGGNFHNLPVLDFGISYEGDRAVLTVPSKEHVNDVVNKYNPGGFTFVEADGLVAADQFLGQLTKKEFPMSSDRTISVHGVPDAFLQYQDRHKGGEPYRFAKERKISLYEHDRVDHLGLVTLPAAEADKFASGAAYIVENLDEPGKIAASGLVDRLLDLYSEYATTSTDNPDDEEYRDVLWQTLEGTARSLGRDILWKPLRSKFLNQEYEIEQSYPHEEIIDGEVVPRYLNPRMTAEKAKHYERYQAARAELEQVFVLNREVCDNKIKEMQQLQGTKGKAQALGTLTLAA